MQKGKGTAILSVFLILLGIYLLLNELDANIPGWDTIWPAFPLAGGLALLAGYALGWQRDPSRVFLGTAATLAGLVFFFFSLKVLDYRDIGTWWPVFVLIGGIAFLAQWAAARFRDWGALFLALVGLIVGGTKLFEVFRPETGELLTKLWPVALILVGLMALLRSLLRRRSR